MKAAWALCRGDARLSDEPLSTAIVPFLGRGSEGANGYAPISPCSAAKTRRATCSAVMTVPSSGLKKAA